MSGSANAARAPEPLIPVTGTVKWFDSVKGYGFVAQDDGGPDVLLHITCLEKSGFQHAYQGARVTCEAGRKENGKLAAVKVTSVEGGVPADASKPKRGFAEVVPLGEAKSLICKRFIGERGFGFFEQEGGEPDVFVHRDTLRRSRINLLILGQEYMVRFGKGPNGFMAAEVRVPKKK